MTVHHRRFVLAAAAALILSSAAGASAKTPPPRKPDLGDAVQGTYAGDVTSDSKGSSHPDVTLTLTRVGKNQVSITSDYPRLPVVTVTLEQAMGKIVNRAGNTAFFFDPSGSPTKLQVSFDNEVSWMGTKR